MGRGQELYKHAKTLIPGGTQLLSKRPEMFLPEQWPAYYGRAKGAYVWDLDGNRYADFATMGVGACTLGYADDDVDAAVIEVVNNGSMSSLNSPEEPELAERLVALHPWADMARFQRCGGEACAVAIRIARAATRKSAVAICGYHGWSDSAMPRRSTVSCCRASTRAAFQESSRALRSHSTTTVSTSSRRS